MPTWTRKIVASTLGRNVVALYGARAIQVLLPLALIAYLSRVVGAENLGHLLFVMAFAQWFMVLVEYGFNFSASRELAESREDGRPLAPTVEGVLGAKGLLACISVVLAGLTICLVPELSARPNLAMWAIPLLVINGFDPIWFYQGTERVTTYFGFSALGRIVGFLPIFFIVNGAADLWLVLASQSFGVGLAFLIAHFDIIRNSGAGRPNRMRIGRSLWNGRHLFMFRLAVSLYTVANGFILGVLSVPAQVTAFAAAERVMRAINQLIEPAGQAVYPYLVRRIRSDFVGGRQDARVFLFLLVGISCGIGALLAVLAPFIAAILVGGSAGALVAVLRVLALVIPLISISHVLGIQWMLPNGLDGPFNRIIIGAGLLNVSLAALLATQFGALGMAICILCAEMCVVVGMLSTLRRRGVRLI